MDDLIKDTTSFTPMNLRPPPSPPINYKHYTMPMTHPTTGELISSYKHAEVWMTAFREDFGGMSEGNNKIGQKGTNTMFVMSPQDIPNILKNRVVTYARVVVDHRPQKADPNHIQIIAGSNLINYPGGLTTRTVDITTSKLHCNSVLSTPNTKYMCLDIKKILPFGPPQLIRIHAHPFCPFPPMDHQAI